MQANSIWNILLIDDDEDDYLITKSMLDATQGKKTRLEWAGTFEAGKQALANFRYDAVLMDYDLGAGSGLDLIRESVANYYPAPMILLTGRGSYQVDLEAMEAGATLYLTKAEVNPLLLERSIRYAIERKRIEQERTQILESIQDGFFAIDKEWQIIYINRRAANNVGCEPEELIGRNIWEAFPKLLGTTLEQNYRTAMQERKPVMFETKGVYQGSWYNVSVYPFQEGISVYWQDITERRRAEEALRESEGRFRAVFERAEIGIAIGDTKGRFIASNSSLERMLGYTKEELRHKSCTDFTHPDDTVTEWILAQELLSGQRDHYEIEIRYIRKDHQMILVRIIGSLVRNKQGEPLLGVVLIEDISERKRAEEALRAKEATLRGILDATKESIWLFDPDGIILMANETALSRFNKTGEEMIGKHFSHFMPAELAEARQRRLRETVETKRPFEFEDVRAGIVFLHSFYPVTDANGDVTSIAVFSRDITERKRVEQALKQRMEELEAS